MFNQLHDRDRQVAEKLRREARSDRPAFSASLHDRIMETVRANQPRPQQRGGARRRHGWTWSLAVAAAVLMAVNAALWISATDSSNGLRSTANRPKVSRRQAADPDSAILAVKPKPSVEDRGVAEPKIDTRRSSVAAAVGEDGLDVVSGLYNAAFNRLDVLQHGEKTVEARLIDEQLATLDHDARLVAGWVLDPLAITLEN
ncbi:MAG: hypothetical protein VX988_05475 [Planctomycetota bacterium]|nr:hypothetical protein [Planctomycetota bacterium]